MSEKSEGEYQLEQMLVDEMFTPDLTDAQRERLARAMGMTICVHCSKPLSGLPTHDLVGCVHHRACCESCHPVTRLKDGTPVYHYGREPEGKG